MKRLDRILLASLAGIVGLCVTSMNLFWLADASAKRSGLEDRAASARLSFDPDGVEKARTRLAELKELRSGQTSATAAAIFDEVSLGRSIKGDASRFGLSLVRYALMKRDSGPVADLSVSGPPEAVAAFIATYDGAEGKPGMLSFRASVRSDARLVEGSARIGYPDPPEDAEGEPGAIKPPRSQAAKLSASAPASEIARLFAPVRTPNQTTPKAVEPPKASPAAIEKTVKATWISFTGRIIGDDGKVHYYFKDSRSGSLVLTQAGKDGGNGIVSDTPETFILRIDGKLYEVRR